MTCGLVHASYSLPEWQAVKLTFFAPCKYICLLFCIYWPMLRLLADQLKICLYICFNVIVIVVVFFSQAFSPPDCTEHEKAVVKAGDELSKIFL